MKLFNILQMTEEQTHEEEGESEQIIPTYEELKQSFENVCFKCNDGTFLHRSPEGGASFLSKRKIIRLYRQYDCLIQAPFRNQTALKRKCFVKLWVNDPNIKQGTVDIDVKHVKPKPKKDATVNEETGDYVCL